MSTPELRLRASLWNLLSTRRDVDNLTLELLGKYHVDLASATPDIADRLAFSLACQLEAIFDLQRTHLQSRTPYSEFDNPELVGAAQDRVAERIPYLLSLSVAKGAFTSLGKLALCSISGGRDGESSLRRVVFVRALVSGARMLCVHPGVAPGARLPSLLRDKSPSGDEALSTCESILTEVCDAALKKVPERHRDLHLPRMGYNREMFPLDESRVMNVVKECTIDFDSSSSDKYWTLYDISWSVVASYVQFWAIKKDVVMAPPYFASVAIDIAAHAMDEARRVLRLSEGVRKCAVLLLDIAAVLSPILLDLKGGVKPDWKANYEKILRENHIPICQEYFAQKTSALEKFEAVLKRREKVLRDGNEELPKLLESIQKQCSDGVKEYNRQFSDRHRRHSEHDSQPIALTKLYVVSCDSTHIITEDQIPRLDEDHDPPRDNGCLNFPEGFVCPACPLGVSLATRLREISPLTKILETAEQKKRDLRKLRRDRENLEQDPGEHSGIETRDLDVTHIAADRSTSGHQGHRAQRVPSESMASSSETSVHSDPGPVESPPTSTSTLGSSFWPRLARRLTLSPSPAASGEQELCSMDLHPLGLDDKQIALSADYKCFIFWTVDKLGLYYDTSEQEPVVVPNPVKNPGQMVASAGYCAIVKRGRNFDEIVFVNPNERFKRFAVHRVMEQVQCLAFSPDGAYLAIGLESGIVQLLKMEKYETPTASNLFLTRDLPVACLSFSADASELVASVRDRSEVHVKTSPRPFVNLDKYYLDRPIPEREDDDQGISSVIRCPKRNLLCITYWTRSGYPLLHDCLRKKGLRLKQHNIGTRVQQAVFSESGRFLILINHNGSIFKVTINDIDSLNVEEIGKLRHLSHAIGKSQILNVKISEDEKELRLVWIKDNRAHVTDYPLD